MPTPFKPNTPPMPKCGLAMKTCYETPGACDEAIRSLENEKGVKLRSYWCRHCVSWHMTKQAKHGAAH